MCVCFMCVWSFFPRLCHALSHDAIVFLGVCPSCNIHRSILAYNEMHKFSLLLYGSIIIRVGE